MDVVVVAAAAAAAAVVVAAAAIAERLAKKRRVPVATPRRWQIVADSKDWAFVRLERCWWR